MSRRTPRGLKGELFAKAPKQMAAKCFWCDVLITIDTATVDHAPPLCLGGGKHDAVLACRRCNGLGSRMLTEWIKRGVRPRKGG